MTDVTRILAAIEEGDSSAADVLLPLVHDALRRMTTTKMAQERPRPDAAGPLGPSPGVLSPRCLRAQRASTWRMRLQTG